MTHAPTMVSLVEDYRADRRARAVWCGCSDFAATFFDPAHRRLIPHIHTEQEIVALLKATDSLLPAGELPPLTRSSHCGMNDAFASE